MFLQCFGGDLPSGGYKASASWHGGVLLISLPEGESHVPAVGMTVEAGGFDGQQMLVHWQNDYGRWSCSPVSPADREQFVTHAPPALSEQLGRWRKSTRKTRAGFHLGWLVLGTFFAIPLLALLLFWLNADRIAGWVAQRVPAAEEKKLGEMVIAQTAASMKLTQQGEAARVVREIGGRLTQGSRYSYQWYVADDPSINAFAIPGGFVVVHSGLIKAADTPEELAGVLAHEVQHVEQRHSLKGMIHGIGLSALMSMALGDMSGSALAGMAQQLGGLKFGREQESQADVEGLKALKQAGINPQGMISFFDKLAKQDGGSIELLSTHPASANRKDMLEMQIKAMGSWQAAPLAYDWTAVKAGLKDMR